jgi:hypothetical protein
MVMIRQEQMEVLSKSKFKQFEDRMVTHLHLTFPDMTKDISDEGLRAFIRIGVDKAEKYGVLVEIDIMQFVEFMMKWGRDFDLDPSRSQAQQILKNQNLDGHAKMDQLIEFDLFGSVGE